MKRSKDASFLPPAKELARLFGIHLATAKRWRSGAIRAPEVVIKIIRGDLSVFGRQWSGWILRGENLYPPENYELPMSEVRTLPFLRQQLAIYQAEYRKIRDELEAERAKIEEQPTPDQWEMHSA